MDIEQLRDYCLSKPRVEESLPFGPDTLVFKIDGRIFLLTSLDTFPLQFNVKCNPDLAIELREQYSSITPGFHMNKKHWNTILIDGTLTIHQLQQFIDHSYDLVKKK